MQNLSLRRFAVLVIALFGFMTVMVLRLADLQLISGAEYSEKSERKLLRSYTVKASRGEIFDRYGRPLVTNRQVFSLRFDYVYWSRDRQNEVILGVLKILDECGDDHSDSLPVTADAPFQFTFPSGEETSESKKLAQFLAANQKKLPQTPTAAELIGALSDYYGLPQDLSDAERRSVAGVRYEMEQRSFSSYNNTFTVASDISIEAVSKLAENHLHLPGTEIVEDSAREYRTDFAANIIGRVGQIYKEEYPELKEKGYPMDAIVGKDGMEKALESWLRGIDGLRSVETNIAGKVTNIIETKPPEPGKNCLLTIDIALQEVVERSLEKTVAAVREKGENSKDKKGADIQGAAAVVISVKTGEVLALANYPTYSLKTFNADYNQLLSDPLKPMFNRAISGAYPPGSTFKMVTALAGLEEGVVTPKTVIVDKGIYTYYAPHYTPACWIYNSYGRTHGRQTVSDAIRNSCNYYFFEVGRLLTIERLNKYARALGLGSATGIELLGEAKGNLAGPESRAAKGGAAWQLGETIQAAIGQTEQQFTPIQLANYIATLVNGGTRYRPHLLKSVRDPLKGDEMYRSEPETVDSTSIKPENLKAIMEGMLGVTEDGTAASVFRSYPIKVGGKTGSAQVREGSSAHGVFTAFAPYDDPEIAVCVIGENAGTGNSVAPVAVDIFDYYFGKDLDIESVSPENTLLR